MSDKFQYRGQFISAWFRSKLGFNRRFSRKCRTRILPAKRASRWRRVFRAPTFFVEVNYAIFLLTSTIFADFLVNVDYWLVSARENRIYYATAAGIDADWLDEEADSCRTSWRRGKVHKESAFWLIAPTIAILRWWRDGFLRSNSRPRWEPRSRWGTTTRGCRRKLHWSRVRIPKQPFLKA
jgi:hypothetical protein